jgi:hypothetical protein
MSHDFMGYLEISMEDLLNVSGKGHTQKFLKPPPPPHKQEVGCLYVDKAIVALPQVFTISYFEYLFPIIFP